MAIIRPTVKMEMEFSGAGGGWTDVTADVVGDVFCSYGIMGNRVTDRVAEPGELIFELNNSITNSGAKLGYYSPSHADVRSGFAIGINCRLEIVSGGNTKRYLYSIIPGGIEPAPGIYGPRRTRVTCEDWMRHAVKFPIQLPALQVDKTIEEVVQAIVALMPIAPASTDYGSGEDIFAYVFDTLGVDTKAITEMKKAALSELGYVAIGRDAVFGEVLIVDGRYTRTDATVGATFDNTMRVIEVVEGEQIANEVETTTYPRQIDAAATTVLFALQRTIQIDPGAGSAKTILGKYRDPTGGSKRVSGTEMVTPRPTTDYLFNTAADGSGADITADLAITDSLGVEGFSAEFQNNNAATGYVTFFRLVGKGIYLYDPTRSKEVDQTSIDLYGSFPLNISQKYQDDPLRGEGFSQYLIQRFSEPMIDVLSMEFTANTDATQMAAFLTQDIGDKFYCVEDVSGVNDDFLINGIEFVIHSNRIIDVRWVPVLADASAFFRLETVGQAELEQTTFLGY